MTHENKDLHARILVESLPCDDLVDRLSKVYFLAIQRGMAVQSEQVSKPSGDESVGSTRTALTQALVSEAAG